MRGWWHFVALGVVVAGLLSLAWIGSDRQTATAQSSTRNLTDLCVNRYNGDARVPRSPGACASTEYAIDLRTQGPITICANRYNGEVRVPRASQCASTETAYSIPDESLTVCVNRYNGDLRLSRRGSCSSTETTAGFGEASAAGGDDYSVYTNIAIDVPASDGVLQNDSWEGTHTLSFDATSAEGGTVQGQNDGSFIYNPPPGFSGQDSFSYSLTADGGTDSATVTLSVSGNTVWFVDNSFDGAGNGTLLTPFSSLAPLSDSANDPDESGDAIYVLLGDSDTTPYGGGLELEADQRLIGQKLAPPQIAPPEHSIALPGTTPEPPIITNTSGDGITVAAGVEVLGVNVDGTSGHGVAGSDIAGTVAINDVLVTTPGSGTGISLASMTGSATFTDVTATAELEIAGEGPLVPTALTVTESTVEIQDGSSITGTSNPDGAGSPAISALNSALTLGSNVTIIGGASALATSEEVTETAPTPGQAYDRETIESFDGVPGMQLSGGSLNASAAQITGGDVNIEISWMLNLISAASVNVDVQVDSTAGPGIDASGTTIDLTGTTVEGGASNTTVTIDLSGGDIDDSTLTSDIETAYGSGARVTGGEFAASSSSQILSGPDVTTDSFLSVDLIDATTVTTSEDTRQTSSPALETTNTRVAVHGSTLDSVTSKSNGQSTSVDIESEPDSVDVVQNQSSQQADVATLAFAADSGAHVLAMSDSFIDSQFPGIAVDAAVSGSATVCVEVTGTDFGDDSLTLSQADLATLGIAQDSTQSFIDANTSVVAVNTSGTIGFGCGNDF